MSDKEKAAAAASRAAQFKNKGKTEDEMRRRRNEVIVSFSPRQACSSHCNSKIGGRQCCLFSPRSCLQAFFPGDCGDQENEEGRYIKQEAECAFDRG